MVQIVWIYNLSPESFSDGDNVALPLQERLAALVVDGADMIDFWAVSTAPDAPIISVEEELQRLKPLLEIKVPVPFSVDTTSAAVAHEAIGHGAIMINDVSGGRADPEMFAVIAQSGVPYVMMYCKNPNGRADREEILYPEWIVQHVMDFFRTQIALAEKAGVARQQIILDPGMGAFVSQDPLDSVKLLQAIAQIKEEFVLPVYVCTSRKWFLWKLSHDTGPSDRVGSSLASAMYAMHQGVDYVRVHDVRWTKQMMEVWKKLYVT